jgi:hypothetical protein
MAKNYLQREIMDDGCIQGCAACGGTVRSDTVSGFDIREIDWIEGSVEELRCT